jgi:hypothetical protein
MVQLFLPQIVSRTDLNQIRKLPEVVHIPSCFESLRYIYFTFYHQTTPRIQDGYAMRKGHVLYRTGRVKIPAAIYIFGFEYAQFNELYADRQSPTSNNIHCRALHGPKFHGPARPVLHTARPGPARFYFCVTKPGPARSLFRPGPARYVFSHRGPARPVHIFTQWFILPNTDK